MPHQTVPNTRFIVFLQVIATAKQEKGKELVKNKAVLDLEKILKNSDLGKKKRVSAKLWVPERGSKKKKTPSLLPKREKTRSLEPCLQSPLYQEGGLAAAGSILNPFGRESPGLLGRGKGGVGGGFGIGVGWVGFGMELLCRGQSPKG